MAEIRVKLLKLSERVNIHLDVPLMKRRVRKIASVPPLKVSGCFPLKSWTQFFTLLSPPPPPPHTPPPSLPPSPSLLLISIDQ